MIEPFSVAFSEKLTINKAKIAKAVWKIKSNAGTGTGFFISENQIVTNAHVIDQVKNLAEITIVQEENLRRVKANKIVSLSIRDDLALLEVDRVVSDFIILPENPLHSSNGYALGYPKGQFQEIKQMSVLTKDYFFSDTFYLSGASGSPMLNEAHQLVGVLYRKAYNYTGIIGLKTLNSFIKDEYFLCEDNVQKCFKSLRESFETNTQEIKNGKDSFNISNHLSARGDLTRAKWWLEKAAEQGYAPAQYYLVWIYGKDGKRIEGAQDWKLAREWYEKAAEQGYALAQVKLARMYYNGSGGAQDLQLARYWFEKAAQQGFALAQFQYELAVMYYQGIGGAQDLQLARYWFEKAAQQGYAMAQYELALMYYYGKGGAQDLQLARYWFEKAAQQGDVLGKYESALMYYYGKGGAQDLQIAIE